MSTGSSLSQRAVRELTTVLDDALEMLRDFGTERDESSLPQRQAPASLLEQCIQLCAQHQTAAPEPIRTVHHFACTGGTLINKCIAAMPNTQLLSEVDPFSTVLDQPTGPRFAPTDLVQLVRQSTRGASQQLVTELFLNSIDIIHDQATRVGLRLVLRDHAHSHYCVGPDVADRPSLRSLVASRHPVLSVLTVRHPIDSFLSLKANGWIHFYPATFDEYCRRYIAFLRAHDDLPRFSYEAFVNDPVQVMRQLCATLDMPFSPEFAEVYGVFALTGDSGRKGERIERRARRPLEAEFVDEVRQSPHYSTLTGILEYRDDT